MKRHYAVILLALLPLLMFAKLPDAGMSLFPGGNSSISRNPAYPLLNIIGRFYEAEHWKDIDKYDYIYHEEGSFHVNKVIEQEMDYGIFDWVAHTIHEISYNDDMKVVEILTGTPDGEGINPVSRFEVGYTDDGNLDFANLYRRDDTGDLVPAMFFDFVLEQDGFCGTYATMFMNGTTIYAKIEIGLDDQGRMISETTSVSIDQENWQIQEKTEHTFHADDSTTFQDMMDYFNSKWALNYIIGFAEMPGMRSGRMDYNYDDGEWLPKKKYEYSHQDGKKIDEIESSYEDGDWQVQRKKLFSYNDYGDLATEINQLPNDAGGFDDNYKYDYTYDTETSTEDNVQTPASDIAINAWPTPFKDKINLRIDSKEPSTLSLEIYNLKGQLVNKLQTQGKGETTWNGKDMQGRDLPAGIYLLKASSDKAFATQKMIKLK
ncbi:MAG TPA: T9SS type A sorting domain-containing protein [Candidatus Cloacimonetes bacterium]|nr:T9SS type A sorting domain-containing protein [Candidatus Cloacimonadota bacterium]